MWLLIELPVLVIDLETGLRVNRKLFTADIVSNNNSYLIYNVKFLRSCTHKLMCNFRSCIHIFFTNTLHWTLSTTFTSTWVIIYKERNNTYSCTGICTVFIVNDNVHPILTHTQFLFTSIRLDIFWTRVMNIMNDRKIE